MCVLEVGPRVHLGDIYLALLREGHEVRVHAEVSPAEHAFSGLIEPVPGWRAELDWVGLADFLFVVHTFKMRLCTKSSA